MTCLVQIYVVLSENFLPIMATLQICKLKLHFSQLETLTHPNYQIQ